MNCSDTPFFSIIVPVYKVEEYIRECINSVLSQTFTDYEVILVDDGSPDNCPVICDEYTNKYNNFFVIHKQNEGLSIARNCGVNIAKGKYLVFLDSDDKLANESSLASVYAVISDKKNIAVLYNCHYQSLLQNQKEDIYFEYFDDRHDNLSFSKICIKKNVLLAACFFIVNRDFLCKRNIFFQPGIFHEDEHWFARLINCSDYIYINSDIFYCYRQQRPGSIINTFNEKRNLDKIWIIEDLLQREDFNKIYKYRICFLLYVLFMDLVKNNCTNKYYFFYIKKRKKFLLCSLRIRFLILFFLLSLFGIKITFYGCKLLRRIKNV